MYTPFELQIVYVKWKIVKRKKLATMPATPEDRGKGLIKAKKSISKKRNLPTNSRCVWSVRHSTSTQTSQKNLEGLTHPTSPSYAKVMMCFWYAQAATLAHVAEKTAAPYCSTK